MKLVKALLLIAIAAVIAFVVLSPKSDKLVGKGSAPTDQKRGDSREKGPVNYSLPLYTKGSALVCPLAMEFDRREGYGLRAAIDAHLSIFGHDEAIAKSGCQEWHEGLPIFLTDEGKKEAAQFDAKNMCGMVDHNEGLIFSCDLQNSPDNIIGNPTKDERTNGSAPDSPPEDVAKLMAQEGAQNDKCRGGSGEDKATLEACDERDTLDEKIKAKDWCWGHDGQVGADKAWERCQGK